jgi:hypothetical protein
MQARIVGARAGVGWLLEGWRIFRAAPAGWMAVVLGYLLLVLIASGIPVLGFALVGLATPGFSVTFMAISRSAKNASSVQFPMLFEGFRQNPRVQLTLGGIYLACVALTFGATTLLMGAPPVAETEPGANTAGNPAAVFGSFFALYVPTMMAFWFAPTLAAWHSSGIVKALFFSFMACLMNWRAFVAYGIAVTLLIFGMSAVAVTAVRLFAPGMEAGRLALPLLIVVFPTILASYYASYRDIFAPEPQPGP